MMGLTRRIEHWLYAERCHAIFHVTREVRSQSHRQGTEVSFIAATGECSVECVRPAHSFAKPAHGLFLDFGSKLRSSETGQLRVQRGYQCFCQNSHVSRRRVHQAKI